MREIVVVGCAGIRRPNVGPSQSAAQIRLRAVSADHENDSVRDSVIRAAVGAERAGLMASQESVLRVRAGTTMTPEDLAQLDVLCSWAEQRLPDLETHLRRFAEVINVSATTGADQGAALLRSTRQS